MDIHRCRFVPYPPQSISALAFTHTSDPSQRAPSELRLALGRENGDIEIWNPLGGRWVHESVLRSSTGKSVDRLAWTQDVEIDEKGSNTIATPGKLRLFSTDSSTVLSEWDVAKGTVKRHTETNFGDLWCIAAQPAARLPKTGKVDQAPPAQLIVGGCGDGSIVLFSTDDDDLRFLRLLSPSPARRAKVLSITWRDRDTVVAGYEDSMIRVISVNDRKVIRTMSLGKNPEGGKSIVWALKCLPDGTILSGDSSGELKIWDSKNFSCIQRLKTHQADIQDIVSNAKGDLVFTVAVDRRTVAYKPIGAQQGKKSQRWTRLVHRRYHDHDIKCAAGYESQGLSFLISGGVDAAPISVPMQNWQTEYHRSLSHLPQQPQMSMAPNQRLLLSWWGRDLHIYHISKRNPDGTTVLAPDFEEQSDYEQLATLRLNGDENVRSAQLSHDGCFIVASTASSTRLFQLRMTRANGKLSLRSRLVDLPPSLRNHGARHVGFSPDGHWLLATRLDNTIVVTKLLLSENQKERPTIYDKTVMLIPQHEKQLTTGLEEYPASINTFAFSPDSRVLATGDLSGSVNAWVLEGNEDLTYTPPESSPSKSDSDSDSGSDSDSDDEDESPIIHGQRWIRTPQGIHFPSLDSVILTLTFRPPSTMQHPPSPEVRPHPTRHTPYALAHSSPSTANLIAITATHNITEFDITTGKMTDWSRRNPSSLLPKNFTRLRDRVMGCFWDTGVDHERQRLWMYGSTWMYMLDLQHDFPAPNRRQQEGQNSLTANEPSAGAVDNVDGNTGTPNKKRKRTTSTSQNRNPGLDPGTGAGNTIKPQDRASTGYHALGVKYAGVGEEEMDIVHLDNRLKAEDDDLAGSGNVSTALLKLRRGTSNSDVKDKEGAEIKREADIEMRDASVAANTDPTTKPNTRLGEPQDEHAIPETNDPKKDGRVGQAERMTKYWGTFQYRSIFGVGVISDGTTATNTNETLLNQNDTETEKEVMDIDIDINVDIDATTSPNQEQTQIQRSPNTLEIIIVERPMHDVDLPPRFDGGQDWDA